MSLCKLFFSYRTWSEIYKAKAPCKKHYEVKTVPKPNMALKYAALDETAKRKRTIIYVFKNGRSTPPLKVVLTIQDIKDWESLFKFIAGMLDIPEGVQQ